MNNDEAFGLLRSLMNKESLSQRDQHKLRVLIEKVAQKWPEQYQQQWVPYLERFPQHWAYITFYAGEVSYLASLAQWMPFASFKFYTYVPNTSKLGELLASRFLSRIKELEINGDRLGDHGIKKLLSHQVLPSLRALRIGHLWHNDDNTLTLLAKSSLTSQLTHLELGYLTSQNLETLMSHAKLAQLEHLSLNLREVDANTLISFLSMPALANVRHLTLNWLYTQSRDAIDPFFEQFYKISMFQNLESLSLGIPSLSGSHLAEIEKEEQLVSLRSLSLSESRLGREDIDALARTSLCKQLHTLDLAKCPLGPHGIDAFLDARSLEGVVRLNLNGSNISTLGAKALSRIQFTQLQELCLQSSAIGDEGLHALAQGGTLNQLRLLDLRDNVIGDAGMDSLTRVPFGHLTSLNLSKNNLGPQSARALADSDALHRLQQLNLAFNQIGDQGAQALAQSNMCELETLDLERNGIKAKGAIALGTSPVLSNLEVLNMRANKVRRDGKQVLASSPFLKEEVRKQFM